MTDARRFKRCALKLNVNVGSIIKVSENFQLLDFFFFQSMSSVDADFRSGTSKGSKSAKLFTMRSQDIGEESCLVRMLRLWVKYWHSMGLFN